MNTGIKNEFDFIKALNNKKICELSFLLQEFIYDLFDINDCNKIIHCNKNIEYEKGDIWIKIDNRKKYVSIKEGNKNSVHSESISTFIKFLKKLGVDKEIINEILKYHYADGTINGSGRYRISASEYKVYNKEVIKVVNEKLNNKKIIDKIIKRFIVKGTKWYYHKIDVLLVGTPESFLFINLKDIYKYLDYKINFISSAIHFSCLTYQPLARVLDYNKKYEYRRHYIQIKWYNLEDCIIELLNLKTQNCLS